MLFNISLILSSWLSFALFYDNAFGWRTAMQARVLFALGSLTFFIDLILPDALCPGVGSASNRNENQKSFLYDKHSQCVRLTTLPPSCADCLKTLRAWTSSSPRGISRLYRDSFTFTLPNIIAYSQSSRSKLKGFEPKNRRKIILRVIIKKDESCVLPSHTGRRHFTLRNGPN